MFHWYTLYNAAGTTEARGFERASALDNAPLGQSKLSGYVVDFVQNPQGPVKQRKLIEYRNPMAAYQYIIDINRICQESNHNWRLNLQGCFGPYIALLLCPLPASLTRASSALPFMMKPYLVGRQFKGYPGMGKQNASGREINGSTARLHWYDWSGSSLTIDDHEKVRWSCC